MNKVISVQNISKQYRLGQVGTGTISHDLNRWWHQLRGKEDPYLKIGESNDRTQKGNSEYVWALRDINFEVEKGEVLGIIGRNGAGKSTLLKILSRTTAPSTGQIKIKGRVASLLEVGTGFHPELTGRENIYLNGAILGMTKNEINRKFDEIVDFAGVEKYIDTPVKRYSSGMYVRLAFAVAANLESEILIVDEVLAVGDAEFQKKCLGKMNEVSRGEGRTILFVSHNMAAIKSLCNKGINLKNGQLEFEGDINASITRYLSHNTSELNTYYESDEERNNEAYIKSVHIFDADQTRKKTLFDVEEKITVVMNIRVNKRITGTSPAADIKYNGQVIYRTIAADRNPYVLESMEPGDYEYSFEMNNPLRKGIYTVDVRIGKLMVSDYDIIEDHLVFEVDELNNNLMYKSYYHGRPGVVGFNLPWQIKTI